MNKKLSMGLILMTLISAFASFYSIYRAIKIPESSAWLVPIIWVSLFVIMLCVASIFLRDKMEVKFVIIASLFLNVIFSPTAVHFAVVFLSIFVMLASLRAVRNDLDLNVKIDLWKSLNTGKFKMIFALSLIICSQYYFTIKSMESSIKVPKADFANISEKLVGPFLGIMNPNFKNASKEDLTVDQFIIQSQSENQNEGADADLEDMSARLVESNIPASVPVAQREMLVREATKNMAGAKQRLLENNQQLVLLEGRKQLSAVAGKQLSGDEKIASIFSDMINDKINSYFDPSIKGDERSSLFSLILTLVLLLTIWPIGSLLSNIWFGIVILIFKLFVRLDLVKIDVITVEREIIA